MKKRACYLFVFDGFADWEPALVTSGLNAYSDFAVKTFSVNGKSVRSMGNMLVTPDLSLNEVSPVKSDLIILPGGNAWEEGGNSEISGFITESFNQNITIAAICAATTFPARLGLYKNVRHTSNGPGYLKKIVPEYGDEKNFINEPCVADKNLITANGAGMIEFAYEIFRHFEIMKGDGLQNWFTLFKSGGMVYKPIG